MSLTVHYGGCVWPKQACDCVEKHGKMPTLTEEEQGLTPEQLVEKWNDWAKSQRRMDRWGVTNGQVVKTWWWGADPKKHRLVTPPDRRAATAAVIELAERKMSNANIARALDISETEVRFLLKGL